jgi:N-acetylglutamate synthase-like GNAT family acetyltransferase
MKENEAKKLLTSFIDSWLNNDKTLFLSCLSDDIIYSESYGPIYRSKSSCEQWFTDWNKKNKVIKWEINYFSFDEGNSKLAVEWFFECNYQGEVHSFNGTSFITIHNGLFTSINEYKTESNHYYPYEVVEKQFIHKPIKDISSNYIIKYCWPDINDLVLLFQQTSWAKNRSFDDISLLIDNSDVVISIYDLNNHLIGFGRIISDGKYRGLLDDIIVDINNRSKGIGKYIVDSLLKKAGNIEEIFLNTGKDHQSFYENCGFTLFSGITMIKRSNENEITV